VSYYIDKKFINLASASLPLFKWKKEDLANCRCPICGDSQKNKTKARGYFFKKNNDFFYKCHNCGAGLSLYRFLEEVSPSLVKEYSLERWKAGENGNSNYVKPDENKMFGISFTPKFKPKAKYLEELTPISKLPKNHVAHEFCKLRRIPEKHYNILYYCDDFGSFMDKLDPDCLSVGKEERLVIPFFNKNGDVVGAQGRHLTLKGESTARTSARYITVKADKSIDRLWYGLWRTDPKKKVYVVEGPLDSLFIPNTIAMVGAGAIEQIHPRLVDSEVVYALDNEPRNKQIVNYIDRLISKGCSVCIWPQNVKEKDINDMIYTKTAKEIKKIIDDNTYAGLEARMHFRNWRRV
jgi:hypothetical protein|tara:strand:+ start:265 stop:1317 length:1053 start_codon:yes stop_codon:yes gene_type:complete